MNLKIHGVSGFLSQLPCLSSEPPDTTGTQSHVNQNTFREGHSAQGDPSTQRLEVYEGTRIPLVWLPENEDVRKLRLSSRRALCLLILQTGQ